MTRRKGEPSAARSAVAETEGTSVVPNLAFTRQVTLQARETLQSLPGTQTHPASAGALANAAAANATGTTLNPFAALGALGLDLFRYLPVSQNLATDMSTAANAPPGSGVGLERRRRNPREPVRRHVLPRLQFRRAADMAAVQQNQQRLVPASEHRAEPESTGRRAAASSARGCAQPSASACAHDAAHADWAVHRSRRRDQALASTRRLAAGGLIFRWDASSDWPALVPVTR